MPIVTLPAGSVTFSCRDGSGTLGYVLVSVNPGAELSTVRAAADTLMHLIEDASGCCVTGYSISYEAVELQTVYGDGMRERQALLVFAADGEDAYAVWALPGVNPGLIASDGSIDPAQSEIAALVSAIINGPWVNPFGQDILSLVASYEQFEP